MRCPLLATIVHSALVVVAGSNPIDAGIVPSAEGTMNYGVVPITEPGLGNVDSKASNDGTLMDVPANNMNAEIEQIGTDTKLAFEATDAFSYHKPFLPLDGMDYFSLLFSAIGLIIAAGGGIGGGGILVPMYIIFLKFRPQHAIALSNFTILGGSIANTIFNIRKSDSSGRSFIDWDIIVMMEPPTMAGAILGSYMASYFSDSVLTASLAIVLAMLSYRTLDKGIKMFHRESDDERTKPFGMPQEFFEGDRSDDEINESQTLIEGGHIEQIDQPTPWKKIYLLILCFSGCSCSVILKGSGNGSIIGVECGSFSFWFLALSVLPWVLGFWIIFRNMLIRENTRSRSTKNHQWDATTTIKYPMVCTIAGVFAGLFGVGGGIVKGPLMLEMGVDPPVAVATVSTMILFTTSAACVSFQVFQFLDMGYGSVCFLMGLICTAFGQSVINAWMSVAKRQSPPVLSIGSVMAVSTFLVALEAFNNFTHDDMNMIFQLPSICSQTG